MQTLSALIEQHFDARFWYTAAGPDTLDVLVYDDMDDLRRDRDNSLAIARATVAADIDPADHPDCFDDVDLSWTYE